MIQKRHKLLNRNSPECRKWSSKFSAGEPPDPRWKSVPPNAESKPTPTPNSATHRRVWRWPQGALSHDFCKMHAFETSVFNDVDLPLSISYYRLHCKMMFRINICIEKITIYRWGEILCFIYVFVIMHTDFMPVYASNSCMLHKMWNSAPWGHTRCDKLKYKYRGWTMCYISH